MFDGTVRVVAKQLPGARDSGGRQRIGGFIDFYAERFERVVVYGYGDDEFLHPNVEVRPVLHPRATVWAILASSVFVAKWYSRTLARQLSRDFQRGDFLHVDFPQMMINVDAGIAPNVLDFHNIEADLMRSRTRGWSWGRRALVASEIRRLDRFERRSARRARLVTACSEADAVRMRARGVPAVHIPNGVSNVPARWSAPLEDQQAVFVGSMDYAPNYEAVEWLTREIWPLVRQQLPAATLTIAGRDAFLVQELVPDGMGIDVVDSPPSLETIYQRSSVALVPLKSGAGTKIKLLEALAHGRAVVSTSVGLEGLDGLEPWVARADGTEAFADKIIDQLTDADLARRGEEAYEFASRNFGWSARIGALAGHLSFEMVQDA
jgi:polysaccharide biosynthesis protein PslH